jgi:hypothetical protein
MRGSDSVKAGETHGASKRAHAEASSNDHMGSLSLSSPCGAPGLRDTVVVIATASRPYVVGSIGTSSWVSPRTRASCGVKKWIA